MRLTEYEELIKKLVSVDRNNPEIYINLQQMIEMFLRRKKVCNCSKDFQDLSYVIAGDLYLQILDGYNVDYLLGYLEKVYRKYAHAYYNESKLSTISYDEAQADPTFVQNGSSVYEYNCVNNKVYLQDIIRVVDEVMMNSCKYEPMSTAFTNLKLSLILSLLRGTEVHFHLNKEQGFYLKLILTNFRRKVVNDGLDITESKVGFKGD